jgi:hypothetical protein
MHASRMNDEGARRQPAVIGGFAGGHDVVHDKLVHAIKKSLFHLSICRTRQSLWWRDDVRYYRYLAVTSCGSPLGYPPFDEYLWPLPARSSVRMHRFDRKTSSSLSDCGLHTNSCDVAINGAPRMNANPNLHRNRLVLPVRFS